MYTVLAVNIRHQQHIDYCWRLPYATRQHYAFNKYRITPSSQQPSNGVVPERSSGKSSKNTKSRGEGFALDFLREGGYIR
jgi:hypothetical protein